MKFAAQLFMLLGLSIFLTFGLQAQEGQKSVSLTITKEVNGVKTVIDTTFMVEDEAEIDVVLDQLGLTTPEPNQSIEKQIVIREMGDSHDSDDDHHAHSPRRRAMLGIYIGGYEGNGIRISSVSKNSGAKNAGLQADDIITEVAGEEVNRSNEIGHVLADYEPGDDVEVVYFRNGQANSTTVTLKAGGIVHVESHGSNNNQRYNYNYNYNYNYDYNDDHDEGVARTDRAFLGIYPAMVSQEVADRNNLQNREGIYVSNIVRSASAEAAGLKAGDVITHLNGERMETSKNLSRVLNKLKPGDPLEITYVRDGQIKSTTAKLGKQEIISRNAGRARLGRMKEVEKAYLGVYLEDESDGGVEITKVSENTAAEDAGLQKRDIIIQMDNEEIDTYRDLSQAMKAFDPGQTIRIKFIRGGKNKQTRATLGSKTSKVWINDGDFDEDVDIDIVIRQFDNQDEGEALRTFMESPSLNVNNFNYFPNPNDGKFRLQFGLPESGDMQIRVYSASGRMIYEEFKRGFSGEYDQEIDISDFVSEGVYFLQVTQNGQGMADKIIVR